MSIRALGKTAAVARLNALRFSMPLPEIAAALASWEYARSGLLVPISIPFPKRSDIEGQEDNLEQASVEQKLKAFADRARLMRGKIAEALHLNANAADRLTFTMTSKEVWYLGPKPCLTLSSMVSAARSAPEKYIELMLLKEFIEDAAFCPNQVFVTGGFGPGVYLGSSNQDTKDRAHLAEIKFSVNGKHGLLLCDVVSKVFQKNSKALSATASKATLAIDVGSGFMLDESAELVMPDIRQGGSAYSSPLI